MGVFISISHDLHNQLNSDLSGNAFKVYLIALRCVKFKHNSRRPDSCSEFFTISHKQIKAMGYKQSKRHFLNGIDELIEKGFIEKMVKGHYQGSTGIKQKNVYKLLEY